MQGIKRNCSNWKRWLQESFISIQQKNDMWLYESLLLTICVLIIYGNIRINTAKGIWCSGDSLVVMDDVFTKIFLTPFFLYLLNRLFRDDMRIQVVLREQRKMVLWSKFMVKNVICSVGFTLNLWLVIFFLVWEWETCS